MRSRSLLLFILALVGLVVAASGLPRSFAAEQPADIPAWLKAHIGDGDGQIAQVVLQRARALYQQKVSAGAVTNPCYFAMDATRPGGFTRRFYVICEADRTFRAVPAGHGNGRNLQGIANFANGIRCAKNFSNAMDSKLTTGGPYVTGETITSFKGYYRNSSGKIRGLQPLVRAVRRRRRHRECQSRAPSAGIRPCCCGAFVFAKIRTARTRTRTVTFRLAMLVDYAGGRSNGCTSWSAADAEQIIPMMKDKPTTLYIYPESTDIAAIAQAVKAGRSPSRAGLYWNASCLKEIGAPKFWPKETLEPILVQYKKDHPSPPPQPPPLCKGQ